MHFRSWDGQTQQAAAPHIRNTYILALRWIPSSERLATLDSSRNLGVFSRLHGGPDSAFLPVHGKSGLGDIKRNDKGCLAATTGYVAATVGSLGFVWSVKDTSKGDLRTLTIAFVCLLYLQLLRPSTSSGILLRKRATLPIYSFHWTVLSYLFFLTMNAACKCSRISLGGLLISAVLR